MLLASKFLTNRPALLSAFFAVVTSLLMARSCLVADQTLTSTETKRPAVASDVMCCGLFNVTMISTLSVDRTLISCDALQAALPLYNYNIS